MEELEALLGTTTNEAQAPAEGEGKKKKKKKDAEAKPVPAEEVKAAAETPAVELTAEEKEAATEAQAQFSHSLGRRHHCRCQLHCLLILLKKDLAVDAAMSCELVRESQRNVLQLCNV